MLNSMKENQDSIRIQLRFRVRVDLEMLEAGILVREIRLVANVALQGTNGFLYAVPAIVDTGSPVTVIPRCDWRDADYRFLSDSDVTISLAGSTIAARLVTVTLRIHDQEHVSPTHEIKAYLLPDDSHPFLLGFEDFLSEVDLHASFARNDACLEFPNSSKGDR